MQEIEWFGSHAHIFAEYPKHDGAPGADYLFYSKTELKQKGRRLKQIILPDNIFMNIYAITLYEE